jgi:hypothetical protein
VSITNLIHIWFELHLTQQLMMIDLTFHATIPVLAGWVGGFGIGNGYMAILIAHVLGSPGFNCCSALHNIQPHPLHGPGVNHAGVGTICISIEPK